MVDLTFEDSRHIFDIENIKEYEFFAYGKRGDYFYGFRKIGDPWNIHVRTTDLGGYYNKVDCIFDLKSIEARSGDIFAARFYPSINTIEVSIADSTKKTRTTETIISKRETYSIERDDFFDFFKSIL